ncbi:hypothetical protein FF1_021843 [Malus domestica]
MQKSKPGFSTRPSSAAVSTTGGCAPTLSAPKASACPFPSYSALPNQLASESMNRPRRTSFRVESVSSNPIPGDGDRLCCSV